DGAWNSSAALAATALGAHVPRTLLIVLAHPRDTDAWCEDLVSFSGSRPATFAAWDAWPVADKVIDELAGQRLRLLRQLQPDPPVRRRYPAQPRRRQRRGDHRDRRRRARRQRPAGHRPPVRLPAGRHVDHPAGAGGTARTG